MKMKFQTQNGWKVQMENRKTLLFLKMKGWTNSIRNIFFMLGLRSVKIDHVSKR